MENIEKKIKENQTRNKKFIRKSRKKEVTKNDINRRINNKVGGEYVKNEFDEDIPF